MRPHLEKAINGLNTFIAVNKDESQLYVTLVLFNDKPIYIHRVVPITSFPILSTEIVKYLGCTALFDSVCNVLTEWAHVDADIVLYIITDGHDNISKNNKKADADKLCNEAIKSGKWNIVHCSSVENMLNVPNFKFDINDIDTLLSSLEI